MKLLDLLKGREKEEPEENEAEDVELYSGMRVEVTTFQGQMLFVAKLLGVRDDRGELHQYSEAAVPLKDEPIPVRIRGYSDRDRKAVYLEGIISPTPRNVWQVEGLRVCQVGNDRAFFRLETSQYATATMFSGLEKGEKPCKLLNISIGGASIASKVRYHHGDKFLLKVKLLEDRPESAIYSQVVRVTEKKDGRFEYGCRFLELTNEDEGQITQNIFAVQRQQRNGR